jgi:hypothetical protein
VKVGEASGAPPRFASAAAAVAAFVPPWAIDHGALSAESDLISEFAPLAAAPSTVLAPAAVVAPTPPDESGTGADKPVIVPPVIAALGIANGPAAYAMLEKHSAKQIKILFMIIPVKQASLRRPSLRMNAAIVVTVNPSMLPRQSLSCNHRACRVPAQQWRCIDRAHTITNPQD